MVSDLPTTSPFKAIADPTRRAVLEALARTELPVEQIAAGFSMSRPAVSKHLRILKQAGLVTERRSGRQNFYRLELDPLAEVAAWLSACRSARRRPAGRKEPVTEAPVAPAEGSAPESDEWRIW
ncbi:MAG: metalloregulator ArsR/SmtB family transcription factor [Thermoanaerobaculia bacterium]